MKKKKQNTQATAGKTKTQQPPQFRLPYQPFENPEKGAKLKQHELNRLLQYHRFDEKESKDVTRQAIISAAGTEIMGTALELPQLREWTIQHMSRLFQAFLHLQAKVDALEKKDGGAENESKKDPK